MARLTVLVVDDDDVFHRWVQEVIADIANVLAVHTPIEALWTLERTPVDLLLCDLRLATAATGLDVLSVVKESWPRVGRILVTGYGAELDGETGVHAIIGKPCEPESLRALLRILPVILDSVRVDE